MEINKTQFDQFKYDAIYKAFKHLFLIKITKYENVVTKPSFLYCLPSDKCVSC